MWPFLLWIRYSDLSRTKAYLGGYDSSALTEKCYLVYRISVWCRGRRCCRLYFLRAHLDNIVIDLKNPILTFGLFIRWHYTRQWQLLLLLADLMDSPLLLLYSWISCFKQIVITSIGSLLWSKQMSTDLHCQEDHRSGRLLLISTFQVLGVGTTVHLSCRPWLLLVE